MNSGRGLCVKSWALSSPQQLLRDRGGRWMAQRSSQQKACWKHLCRLSRAVGTQRGASLETASLHDSQTSVTACCSVTPTWHAGLLLPAPATRISGLSGQQVFIPPMPERVTLAATSRLTFAELVMMHFSELGPHTEFEGQGARFSAACKAVVFFKTTHPWSARR